MRFHIRHTTTYRYEHPVSLGYHVFRLTPRVDEWLKLDSFRLSLYPRPVELNSFVDIEGNPISTAVFEGQVQEFRVATESFGETFLRILPPTEPFDLPLDYSKIGADEKLLKGWLRAELLGGDVPAFADAVSAEAAPGPLGFLDALARRMHETLQDVSRLTGNPLEPETTLRLGKGSCRDFAVLFNACCRYRGIASRFVSGYIEAPQGDSQHMHAWSEVLLPGLGWVPYDPTRGGIAGEEHIAIAAAAEPLEAAPLTGGYIGNSLSEMSVELMVDSGGSLVAG